MFSGRQEKKSWRGKEDGHPRFHPAPPVRAFYLSGVGGGGPVNLVLLAITMSTDLIRTVVQSFYADIWNRRDKSKIAVLLSPNFTFRGSLGETRTGHDGFASYVDFVYDAVAGFRCDIVELIVEGSKAF